MTATSPEWRLWSERSARAIALLALAAAWWLTGRPFAPDVQATEAAVRADDVRVLAAAASDPRRTTLDLSLSAVPNAATRAVLHAAKQADVRVFWHPEADALPAVALGASPLVDPGGGTRVRASTSDSSPVLLSDSLGWLDSTAVSAGGVQWPVQGEARALRVGQRGTVAEVAAVASPRLGRVRLFAAAGWESRFAVDALEEAGWEVDAEFSIAPRVAVTSGAPAALDTARYAAVIALDSTAWSSAAAIARYVASGGGVVLFPGAAEGRAFAAVRLGSVGLPLVGIPGGLRGPTPRTGLSVYPIGGLSDDAVVLERDAREGAPVAVVAARRGAGRVVQVGWTESWEWRMLGGDDAVAAHRDWWRALVQRAAYAPSLNSLARWSPLPGAAAPLADLVARVGVPREATAEAEADGSVPSPAPAWLFLVAAVALLTEWWSRRLRGAR